MNIIEILNYYNLQEVRPEKMYMSDEEIQDVYEFDEIGLQICCKNDIIVTAIATKLLDE